MLADVSAGSLWEILACVLDVFPLGFFVVCVRSACLPFGCDVSPLGLVLFLRVSGVFALWMRLSPLDQRCPEVVM